MKGSVWTKALEECADPGRAKSHLERLADTTAGPVLKKATLEQARLLTALLAGSRALSETLIAHPEWVDALQPDLLQYPRQPQGLSREVGKWLNPLMATGDFREALSCLREFQQRELLRLGARDLARLGEVSEITRELSDVADVCLDAVWQMCRRQLEQRFGSPFHEDAGGNWRPTGFCVFGLGKFGGQELNYSSDVDILFVYDEEGQVFKEQPVKGSVSGRGMSNHEFFKRLAEAMVREITRVEPEGTLYRVDLRLRPEGDSGPLVRSLGSYENYYAQWGQTWERMMLIKARGVAGDRALAAEFLEMVQPFRYPRSLSERVHREVADTKSRIENEVVKSGEIDRNVKLGRGGIREIEFTVQLLQLLNAGRMPFLQGAQTLPTLRKLGQYRLLREEDVDHLSSAYCFLRDVEHRLQMEDNRQTHTIPTSRPARERLARLMGFKTLKEFESTLALHTRRVRAVYDRVLKTDESPAESSLPGDFREREKEWKKILAGHGFQDPDKAIRLFHEFAHGPGYVHVSGRTIELAFELVPRFLALCPKPGKRNNPASDVQLSDPDRVLTRLDSFITAYGTRAMLFELWTRNTSVFDLLLTLFDRSEFLAETAIRTPDLVDELMLSGRLRQSKSAEETLDDLRYGLEDEDQCLWLRRYHETEFMRIGLRDILGLSEYEQNLRELSALAEACLQYALEVVCQRHKLKNPPLAIVGMGKLGGRELGYGSDLDIVFVADAPVKELPGLQPIATEVMDLLSRRTEQGIVFETDARLRPDGEKGLLVNSLKGYEEYYLQRALPWEIQALSRQRPVAGNTKVGSLFAELAARMTDFSSLSVMTPKEQRPKSGRLLPACATPDWKQEIHRMRLRIEKERTPAGQDALAIKTGRGGLIDAEFIAQSMCLEHGWHEPNTLAALNRARDEKAIPLGEADKLIGNYCQLRRLEGILRRWSYEGETVLPLEPEAYRRVSMRCGFGSAEEFRKAVASWRTAIREVYEKVIASG